MRKLSLWLLLPVILFFSEGCYTQFVTHETEITVPDSATVNVTNNYDIDYVGYGYRYSGFGYYGGYQPYWYDGFYTPYYGPHRAYIYPWRPFIHRPIVIHKPIWRFPFGKEPRRHFGTNWEILKPTNPPKHGGMIGTPGGPRRESGSVRDAIIKRDGSNPRFVPQRETQNTRLMPQRIQMPPTSRAPMTRDNNQRVGVSRNEGQRNNYTPMSRGNERNYPINTPTFSQPQHNSSPAPASNSGGSRSSGATRSGKER